MKAVVTGGNGFIGSHIVDRLIELGYEVVVIDDNSAESNEKFYFNSKAKNVKKSVCEYDILKSEFSNADLVFHLAAESRIQPAIANPTKAAQVNVVGTCNVLQAARECGVKRVIYSSTSSGYGLANEPPLKEDMPKDCLNPYSVTKCAGEDLCQMYTKLFGLETVVLRYFNVYGERHPLKGTYAPVVGLFLRQAESGTPMTIVGDGNQRRDFTYVGDVVEANTLSSQSPASDVSGHIFNVGTGTNTSVNELAKIIGTEHTFIPERLGEARETLADISKIKKAMGWSPKVKFEDWVLKEKKKMKIGE